MPGIILELEPHVADALRVRDIRRPHPDDDEWNDIIPMMMPNGAADEPPPASNNNSNNCQNGDDDDDDDDDSYSSYPVLWINVQQLVGYNSLPPDPEPIRQQLQQVLMLHDDFETHVSELFASGVARHAMSSSSSPPPDEEWMMVPYPYPNVRRLYQRLLRSHPLPVVDRLLEHLRHCHQPLHWKLELLQELEYLVSTQQRNHYQSLRASKLEQLYLVRQLFVDKLQQARDRLPVKENQWKEEDDDEYSSQESAAADDAYVLMSDLESDATGSCAKSRSNTINSHDDASATGSDDLNLGDNNENKSSEEEEILLRGLDETVVATGDWDEPSPSQAEELDTPTSASLDEIHLMSDDVRKTMAIVQSLEKRLSRIDDLLESLQDEEWQEEEEEGQEQQYDVPPASEPTPTDGRSLLDEILAMILGSTTSKDASILNEEHYQWLQREHRFIVDGWIEEFGKLPPPVTLATKKGARRANVRNLIVQPESNDSHDLDIQASRKGVESVTRDRLVESNAVVDCWEELVEPTESLPPSKPQVTIGLRPGGRIQ